MKRLEVSGAVRHIIYVIRRLKVNTFSGIQEKDGQIDANRCAVPIRPSFLSPAKRFFINQCYFNVATAFNIHQYGYNLIPDRWNLFRTHLSKILHRMG
jgi:hypothetical protein